MKVREKIIEEIVIVANDNEVIAVISDNEIIEKDGFKVNIKLASPKDKLI